MMSRCFFLLASSAVLTAGLTPAWADPPAAEPGQAIFRVWMPRESNAAVGAESLPLTPAALEEIRREASLPGDGALPGNSAGTGAEMRSGAGAGSVTDGDAVKAGLASDDALRGCEVPGMPVILDTRFPVTFVDHGDQVLMRFAEWDAERVIYMNPAAGPPQQAHSARGVSFGRWEGETLAIFTLYIDYPFFDRQGTPQSRDVTVLERYTPSADGRRLDWAYTVTDAATFETPVTRRGFFAALTTGVSEPVDC